MQFGGVDLSGVDYDLTVIQPLYIPNMPPTRMAGIEIGDKTYGFISRLAQRQIDVSCIVVGTSTNDLLANLDRISSVLNPQAGEKALIVEPFTDRYWNARVADAVVWDRVAPLRAISIISFICPDPLAYSTTEVQTTVDIDADPDTVVIVNAGSGYARPVWRLLPGEFIATATVILENLTTGESLSIYATVPVSWNIGGDVDVDSENMTIIPSSYMSDISGQFPRLAPGSNSIRVTNMSDTGQLRYTYRARYL